MNTIRPFSPSSTPCVGTAPASIAAAIKPTTAMRIPGAPQVTPARVRPETARGNKSDVLLRWAGGPGRGIEAAMSARPEGRAGSRGASRRAIRAASEQVAVEIQHYIQEQAL